MLNKCWTNMNCEFWKSWQSQPIHFNVSLENYWFGTTKLMNKVLNDEFKRAIFMHVNIFVVNIVCMFCCITCSSVQLIIPNMFPDESKKWSSRPQTTSSWQHTMSAAHTGQKFFVLILLTYCLFIYYWHGF